MTLPHWAPADADETAIWQGKPRLGVIYPAVGFGVIAGIGVGGITTIIGRGFVNSSPFLAVVSVLFGGLAVAVPVGLALLWRQSTRYLLTDAALYHRSGVFWLTVTELPLAKIQNTSYAQGIFGTIFDHGNITIDTASSSGAEITLRGLDGPQAIQQQIARTAPDMTDSTELPGTVQQWKDVYAEVRRLREAIET